MDLGKPNVDYIICALKVQLLFDNERTSIYDATGRLNACFCSVAVSG